MAKKKQKQSMKRKGQKQHKKKKTPDLTIEVSQTKSDIKTFIEKFKSDVNKKRKSYQSYTQKLQKKKP